MPRGKNNISDYIVTTRNKIPFKTHKQIWLWRKRRRKEKAIQRFKTRILEAVLKHFNSDLGQAQDWLTLHLIKPYNRTPQQLMEKEHYETLVKYINKHLSVKVPPTSF